MRAALAAHAAAEAPAECCGVLIGRADGERHLVAEALPGRNRSATHDFYDLHPEDFLAADARAETLDLSVLGFYHSHPRGPARLSHSDERLAWTGHVYLLIAPPIGSGCGFHAWIRPRDGAGFDPVLIE